MTSVAIGVWTANSEYMPNETPGNRATKLYNMISLAFRTVTAQFHIFVVSEFFFANANLGQDDLRWYSREDRDLVLRELAGMSRLKPRLLLVGGSILWFDTQKPMFGEKVWRIYNEAPVHYDGNQMKLHRKRVPGGEVCAHDYLRLGHVRGDTIDRTYTTSARSEDDQRFWKRSTDNRGLTELSNRLRDTYTDEDGTANVPSAPGLRRVQDRYLNRVRYQHGTGEGSFQLPTNGLTGGIEVCMEHSQGDYSATSALGATTFHIVTANTVTCHAAERGATDHTHIADPGLFVHCSAGGQPTAVTSNGNARALVDGWTQVTDSCSVTRVDLPLGI